jgi:hypothetical protein
MIVQECRNLLVPAENPAGKRAVSYCANPASCGSLQQTDDRLPISARSDRPEQERVPPFRQAFLSDDRVTAKLRKDSSDDPNPDRIFHARWQHCGTGEPGGQGAISRSCASRSAGSAGGIGAAYLVATTIPSIRGSRSETRREHRAGPYRDDFPKIRAGFPIPRQEIARSDGASPLPSTIADGAKRMRTK